MLTLKKNLEQKANEIVKNQPLYLKNSILPESQINLIMQN